MTEHGARPLEARPREVRVVTSDGVALWTARQGSGPPLVLCHGGPGMWDYLAPVAGFVDDIVTVHRYDQRGSRRSEGDGPYTIERFADDLDDIRAHFGYRQWIVGGHSWGAALALHYALAHPARVRALVYLSGTGIGWDWHAEYHREAAGRRSSEENDRLAELKQRERTPPEEHERRVLAWHPDYADRERARELAAALDEPVAINDEANAALARELKARAEPDLAAACSRLDVRVLIVHGAHDPRPSWAIESLAASLPRSRVELIEAAGHLLWVEAPEATRAVLRSFLAPLG